MPEMVCVACGRGFMAAKGRKSCSWACRNEELSRRTKGRPAHNKGVSHAKPMVAKCGHCDVLFNVTGRSKRHRAKLGQVTYCSASCLRDGKAKKISASLMGHPPHYMSAEALERVRRLHTGHKYNVGRKMTPEQRAARSGPNSWCWRGGVTREYARLRSKQECVNWAKAVKARDNHTCQWCGQVGGRLAADHIKSFIDHPELRFDLSNGRTLCYPCHAKTPSYGKRRAVA